MRKCANCAQDVCVENPHVLTTYATDGETVEKLYLCRECSACILTLEAYYSYDSSLKGEE
jgi:hypothetical protein